MCESCLPACLPGPASIAWLAGLSRPAPVGFARSHSPPPADTRFPLFPVAPQPARSEDRDLASGDHPRQRALNARVARDRRWSSLLLPFSFGLTFAVKTIDARGVPPAQPEALRGSGAAGCDPGVPTALADEAKYAVACNAYIGWLEARRAAVLSELATLA
jgi:hypothetical protein